jgi:hypothetical protein
MGSNSADRKSPEFYAVSPLDAGEERATPALDARFTRRHPLAHPPNSTQIVRKNQKNNTECNY